MSLNAEIEGRKLFGVIFKTDKENGYNNEELKTLVMVNASTKRYAVLKSQVKMQNEGMNIEDLWLHDKTIEIENKDSINTKEFHNVFYM